MESFVFIGFLLVIFVFIIPISCLFSISKLKMIVGDLEEKLRRLNTTVKNLKQELEALKRSGIIVGEPVKSKVEPMSTPTSASTIEKLLKIEIPKIQTPVPSIATKLHIEEEEPQPIKGQPEPLIPTSFDWENFLSVKLFAWLGGFALFLGTVFLVKYSIDNNLISYELRIVMGLLLGIGVIVGGFFIDQKKYAFTAQALCGSGVAILYFIYYILYSLFFFTNTIRIKLSHGQLLQRQE